MLGGQPGRAIDPPYFFFSYHRSKYRPDDGSDPNMWVKKLYAALCRDVHQLTSTPNPGFMDVQTPLASSWPDELGAELASCRVFVALLSPGYFNSEFCGREWAAFTERVRTQAPGNGQHAAIIPALWTPFRLEELPPELGNLQVIPPGFPTSYSEEGFFALMRLRRYSSAYKESVWLMAKTIKKAAEAIGLRPCAPIDLNATENAFAGHQSGSVTRQIRITVAAYPAFHGKGQCLGL